MYREQSIGCMGVAGLSVEVAFPARELAIVLPGNVANVLAGSDILDLAFVFGMVADCREKARKRIDCFLGRGAGDQMQEPSLVVVRCVEGGFPRFNCFLYVYSVSIAIMTLQ